MSWCNRQMLSDDKWNSGSLQLTFFFLFLSVLNTGAHNESNKFSSEIVTTPIVKNILIFDTPTAAEQVVPITWRKEFISMNCAEYQLFPHYFVWVFFKFRLFASLATLTICLRIKDHICMKDYYLSLDKFKGTSTPNSYFPLSCLRLNN